MANQITKKRQDSELAQPERIHSGRAYVPNVDIIDKGDEFMILADMPGVKAENLDVTYEQGVLEIHGRVKPRQDERKTNYLLREYAVGDYYRSFRLGEQLDAEHISAEMKQGVLTLHLPKAEAAKRKKIEVKTA